MRNYAEQKMGKLEFLVVKGGTKKKVPAKRVNIVSLKVIKEGNILYKDRQVRSPQDSYDIIRTFLEDSDREMFIAMSLDIKKQPTNIQICHIGSMNASIVHPREVLKMAILSNAASLIIFHNHPSGQVQPSPEHHEVTKRLKAAGEIMGVELLDHLIIGENTFLSFKERGYL